MKQLLTIVFIGLVFTSCGPNKEQIKEEKNSSTIKIGNLEVMTEDLGSMTWDDAVKACADLGDGWRLPTKDELNVLYENQYEIGGFANLNYWSSTEYDFYSAWFQYFYNGFQFYFLKTNTSYVRAVRAF